MAWHQVVAVVAHELGHWALRHELQSFALQQLYFLAVLTSWQWVCDAHAGPLLSSLGFSVQHRHDRLLLLILYLTMIVAPVDHVLSYVVNAISRQVQCSWPAHPHRAAD